MMRAFSRRPVPLILPSAQALAPHQAAASLRPRLPPSHGRGRDAGVGWKAGKRRGRGPGRRCLPIGQDRTGRAEPSGRGSRCHSKGRVSPAELTDGARSVSARAKAAGRQAARRRERLWRRAGDREGWKEGKSERAFLVGAARRV